MQYQIPYRIRGFEPIWKCFYTLQIITFVLHLMTTTSAYWIAMAYLTPGIDWSFMKNNINAEYIYHTQFIVMLIQGSISLHAWQIVKL